MELILSLQYRPSLHRLALTDTIQRQTLFCLARLYLPAFYHRDSNTADSPAYVTCKEPSLRLTVSSKSEFTHRPEDRSFGVTIKGGAIPQHIRCSMYFDRKRLVEISKDSFHCRPLNILHKVPFGLP